MLNLVLVALASLYVRNWSDILVYGPILLFSTFYSYYIQYLVDFYRIPVYTRIDMDLF